MTQDQTRALVERLRQHQDWMREPDFEDDFSLDKVVEWLNRRPTAAFLETANFIERQSRIIAVHEQQVKDGAELIERIQRALMFWMPSIDMRLDPATRDLAAQDAHLLAGYTGTTDEPCWGDGILERTLAAESSLNAAVEAEREACARIAETLAMGMFNHPEAIASAIRSRAAGGNEN